MTPRAVSIRTALAAILVVSAGTPLSQQNTAQRGRRDVPQDGAPRASPEKTDRERASARDSAAWSIVSWPGGAVENGGRTARLQAPVRPGSFMKVPALVAALASGTVSAATRVPCRGEATIDGRVIRCSHPRLRHAVGPAEALALSCNVFFATIGRRLPRARFDAVLTALGLPPAPAGAPMFLAATGLQASSVTAGRLLDAFVRLVRDPGVVPIDAAGRQLVLEGLRGSGAVGTASAFAERGVTALAKTGTATGPAGGVEGLVVAAWPADAPTHAIVLLAPGAGSQAAVLAADIAAGTATGRASEARPSRAATTVRPGASRVWLRVGFPDDAGGYDVRTMTLEEYVPQVVAGEAVTASPPAALEALAITARTFALANRARHSHEGFDLCTLTHCQVLRRPDAAARRAGAATARRVLAWKGRVAAIYYTASCGGHSERPSAVWAGAADPPYLPIRRDEACRGEPRWAAEIGAPDLERALRAGGFRGGPLRGVRRVGRTSSGRTAWLALDGMAPDVVGAQEFRRLVGRTLGWHLLKSTYFEVRRTGAGYRFEGRGFGHGVGLCVIGMTNRAASGERRADRLLRAYFPGLAIVGRTALAGDPAVPPARAASAPAPIEDASTRQEAARFALALPAEAESDRGALTALVGRLLDELERMTGRTHPAELRLVFHPSPRSFRRETGEPWWSAARTRDGRIDLLPVAVLRARGTLDTTLRHELAHVLTASVLNGRALWVREGVAMHFAGERPASAVGRAGGVTSAVRCPVDQDLRAPMSAGAARQAYDLAAACVARALAQGQRWEEIGASTR